MNGWIDRRESVRDRIIKCTDCCWWWTRPAGDRRKFRKFDLHKDFKLIMRKWLQVHSKHLRNASRQLICWKGWDECRVGNVWCSPDSGQHVPGQREVEHFLFGNFQNRVTNATRISFNRPLRTQIRWYCRKLQLHRGLQGSLKVREIVYTFFDKLGDGFHRTIPLIYEVRTARIPTQGARMDRLMECLLKKEFRHYPL